MTEQGLTGIPHLEMEELFLAELTVTLMTSTQV